jgi:hypothetical protein
MDLQHDSTADERTGLGSGDESDSESETSTGPRLEPRRPHGAETPIQDAAADTMDDDPVQADRGPTHGMRGLAEGQLERRPFVVAYPSRVQDLAGARNRAQRADANASYELEITIHKRQDKSIRTISITTGLGYCQMGKVTWPRIHIVW